MARKKIKKVSVAELDPITGSIVDTTNIDNKSSNTYSANIIDKFNSYSTEETVVGTWINGKPLYRKVMEVIIPTTTADGTVAETSYTVSDNVHRIINIQGYADVTTSASYTIYFPTVITNSNYKLFARQNISDNNKLQIQNAIKAFSGFTAFLTVEYTKTTD